MWNSFVNLFQNKGEKQANAHVHKTWKEVVLTASSPRLELPANCNSTIKLWDHQKAMLAKCKFIEDHPTIVKTKVLFSERYSKPLEIEPPQDCALGIMNDPPGAGKTYAMLSLIAMDCIDHPELSTNQTVIVAPKNIIKQWEMAIQTMFDTTLNEPDSNKDISILPDVKIKKTKKTKALKNGDVEKEDSLVSEQAPPKKIRWAVATYEMINRLHLVKSALNHFQIILIEDILIDTFALASQLPIRRFVIDEVDNLSGLMTHPIKAEKVWFLSASFNPDLEQSTNIPFTFDRTTIPFFICCSDSNFIATSVKLEDPITSVIECEDDDIALFNNIVPSNVMTSLHCGNNQQLAKHVGYTAETQERLAINIAKWYQTEIIEIISKQSKRVQDLNEQISELADDKLSYQYVNLKQTLSSAEKLVATTRGWKKMFDERLEVFKTPIKTKWHQFEKEIVESIVIDKESKWLVFNDDHTSLITAQQKLKSRNIASEMLDGGNSESVNKTLEAFKNGNTQVLLINSAFEGCGLNLETATHVLFMHATNNALVEQIVGRAQRFGRKGKLKIIGLFNMLELPSVTGILSIGA